jgi:hypothetical protein
MTTWTEQPNGSHVAKIGRYRVKIMTPQPWAFWRGDHKGVPCHTGPGESRTIAFQGYMSSSAFTLEGAKAAAEWRAKSVPIHGRAMPDELKPAAEREAERLWRETVDHVDSTFGTS